MMRLFTLVITLFMGTSILFAQNGGELSGKVTNDKGEPVPFATVVVKNNGSMVTGTKTDFDGFYTIKPLAPGSYDIEISEIGFTTSITRGVKIGIDKLTTLDKKLNVASKELGVVDVIDYKNPLIDKDDPSDHNNISHDEINNMAPRDLSGIVATTAGVYEEGDGSLNIRGGRNYATEYFVDGVRVNGSANVPIEGVEQVEVITGGVPAKYGDATGGIVNIVTRGPADRLGGNITAITSEGMDDQGYNDVNFFLTGPIWTKYKGTDTANTKIGFFIAGEYNRTQDPTSNYGGVYKLKNSVLDSLNLHPLIPNPISSSFLLASDTITSNSMQKVNMNQNVASNEYTGTGKLDFKLSESIDLTVGASADYISKHDFEYNYSLMNSANNPLEKDLSWRGFARLTQRFGKSNNGETQAKSAFQNAFYSVQFDYSKVYNTIENDRNGFNPFDYGYLGKYNVLTAPSFTYGKDSVSGKTGYIQTGVQDTLVTFAPGTFNPLTSNYVTQYFKLAGKDTSVYYQNFSEIQQNGGLLNGYEPQEIYSLWQPTGVTFPEYVINNQDQYRLTLQGAVDVQKPGTSVRNKHSLEFGLEFEQRVERNYGLLTIAPSGGVSLWEIMRELANAQLQDLDKANPILLIDGVKYSANGPHPAFGANDTVLYNPLYIDSAQTFFDKSLRQKLGLPIDGTTPINIDALDPSVFSLSMFTPDNLFNNGNSMIAYNGYNYLGQISGKNPSFSDFFTQKDANGNYTRPIGAFMPIYTAGYIQDKFNFKDLLFNIGLRVDRYDANTQVLYDPYSLYQILTVSQAVGRIVANGFPAPNIPASMGSNYAVYVNNYESPDPQILGYRNGDQWYDANGNQITDASIIARNSASGSITPFLDPTKVTAGALTIQSPNYDPSISFKSYVPQINVMPRLSFSFNITDEALFYAHYDILTQRPNEGFNFITPDKYYYFNEYAVNGALNNPDLQPEKTIDYEVGFRQKISTNSAITFSSFYRELRDMVQIRNYSYAYPENYQSYDNIDFGTVKGFTFGYDLRRIKATNFSLLANYTIQFADGTGSSIGSQAGIIADGQPNLRVIAPFDYDARNLINVSADYRFAEGKDYNGPKVNGKNILENAGINLLLTGRSGTPYTEWASAVPEIEDGVAFKTVSVGELNGERLPWTFRVDLKVNKSFNITSKKKAAEATNTGKIRAYYLNVYVLIQNLLNTANVLGVYRYTGSATDDGYLASPTGQQAISEQVYPAAFTSQYNVKMLNPGNFQLPRTVRIGVEFNF